MEEGSFRPPPGAGPPFNLKLTRKLQVANRELLGVLMATYASGETNLNSSTMASMPLPLPVGLRLSAAERPGPGTRAAQWEPLGPAEWESAAAAGPARGSESH